MNQEVITSSQKIKAALIVDNNRLTKWQRLALEHASDLLDIRVVLNCKNTRTKKRPVVHGFYYVLNILALKNQWSKSSDYQSPPNASVIDFESDYEGMWQRIPESVAAELEKQGVEVVIKFGMSLMRVDDVIGKYPILSFHHGDPSKFRGRPAGFYELLTNADKQGIIVQQITNKLDGGKILAFAESKLFHHSYKKTAELAYSLSRFLLRKALVNLMAGRSVDLETNGKNYRLPSNLTVLRFAILLFCRKVRYLCYGLLWEKKWQVGTLPHELDLEGSNTISARAIDVLEIASKYTFYADPFFSLDKSKIRLEALGKRNGLGDIVEIPVAAPKESQVILTGTHYSYPFPFMLDGVEQLLPEVASHSSPYFYSLEDAERKQTSLRGLEDARIADATLFEHENCWYLFFGYNANARFYLNLWVADSPRGEFQKHPQSPVCITPSSSRMGGRIHVANNKLYRFGQNNERGYGAGITISRISKLSPLEYEEVICGSVGIDDACGPHSIDIDNEGGRLLIDFYRDRFSLLAGVRRLMARISK